MQPLLNIVLWVLSIQSSLRVLEASIIVDLPPYGRLRGRDREFYYSYESIPYAEPPIGELRFESPREYASNWTTEYDATRTPPICMQWDQFTPGNDKISGVEDCLVVNIYRPKDASGQVESNLPVLVYIHGGAFMFGSTMENDHTPLLRDGRFIVVKFTYRLGPLGFLSTDDDVIPGNFGLKDQRLALKWIKRHIANFGGDANKILVTGFSAGGASVHFQLLQPDFAEYATAAISFSGTAFCPWALLRKSRERAFEMGRHLNCSGLETSNDLKKCLRERKPEQIVRDVRNFLVFGYNPFTTFGPVVEAQTVSDGFLKATPEDIIKAGNSSKVPWLASYTAQDGGYNAAELLQKSPRRDELIEELNDRWYDLAPYMLFSKDRMSSIEELDDYSMAMKNQYLGDKEFSVETYRNVQQMFTDVLFKNGVEKAVRLHRKYGTSPVFAYTYDNPADANGAMVLSQRTDIDFGTVHGDDFVLLLPNIALTTPPRQDQQIISQKLIKMIWDFVQNSNELVYGSCDFVNNVGQDQLALMVINRDRCENKLLSHFP